MLRRHTRFGKIGSFNQLNTSSGANILRNSREIVSQNKTSLFFQKSHDEMYNIVGNIEGSYVNPP
jgi:hypothetical protein